MAPTKIYITSLANAQPGKRPLTAIAMPLTAMETKPMIMDSTSPLNQPRKRQRLTHLSPEEKLMRRKLKNRVAAQTARDRKKAHMDSVEERLEKMEKIAQKIQLENATLKRRNTSLMAENVELKKRLGLENQAPQMTTKVGTVTTVKKEFKSPESAAGTDLDSLNIPNGSHDFESDVLLGLLEGLQEQITSSGPTQPENGTSQSAAGNCQRNAGIDTTLVGPTAEELESLKELIRFDHEYVKKPSALAHQTLNVITTCNKLAIELKNSENKVRKDTQDRDGLMTPEIELHMDTVDLVPSLLDSTEGTFDCDISDLLLFDPSNCADTKSESGHSDSSGNDSAFGDMPRSPFSDDTAMSPSGSLGDGLWEESFTDLFPSLDDL